MLATTGRGMTAVVGIDTRRNPADMERKAHPIEVSTEGQSDSRNENFVDGNAVRTAPLRHGPEIRPADVDGVDER